MPEWHPLMEVGVAEIDRDHQVLVEKLNELGQAMKRGQGRDAVAALLAFLSEYAERHFAMEERLMRENGYPDYEEHRSRHEGFRRDLQEKVSAYQADPGDRGITLDIHGWAMGWLRDHALTVDAKLGDFLNRES